MQTSNNHGLASQHEVITWIACADELPDDSTTVLIRMLDSDERVWLGYLYGDGGWMTVEGFKAGRVSHWAEMPAGPEVKHA